MIRAPWQGIEQRCQARLPYRSLLESPYSWGWSRCYIISGLHRSPNATPYLSHLVGKPFSPGRRNAPSHRLAPRQTIAQQLPPPGTPYHTPDRIDLELERHPKIPDFATHPNDNSAFAFCRNSLLLLSMRTQPLSMLIAQRRSEGFAHLIARNSVNPNKCARAVRQA